MPRLVVPRVAPAVTLCSVRRRVSWCTRSKAGNASREAHVWEYERALHRARLISCKASTEVISLFRSSNVGSPSLDSCGTMGLSRFILGILVILECVLREKVIVDLIVWLCSWCGVALRLVWCGFACFGPSRTVLPDVRGSSVTSSLCR